MIVAAGEFKAKCLKLMDEVQHKHIHITITKHGKSVAEVVPVESSDPTACFGLLSGTITENGDIVAGIGEAWEANV